MPVNENAASLHPNESKSQLIVAKWQDVVWYEPKRIKKVVAEKEMYMWFRFAHSDKVAIPVQLRHSYLCKTRSSSLEVRTSKSNPKSICVRC